MPKNRFLTTTQKQVLEAIGPDRGYFNVADNRLGMRRTTMHTHLSDVWKKYLDALETIADYYPIFHGRFSRHEDALKSVRRKLRRRKREYERSLEARWWRK